MTKIGGESSPNAECQTNKHGMFANRSGTNYGRHKNGLNHTIERPRFFDLSPRTLGPRPQRRGSFVFKDRPS